MFRFERGKGRIRFSAVADHYKNIEKIYNYGGENFSYLTIEKCSFGRYFKSRPKREWRYVHIK